jgi:general secretion pathway protein G
MSGTIPITHASPRSKRSARRAFTIIEVIVIVVILGVIAAVIAPRLLGRIGQSKQSVAKVNAGTLANNMRLFIADHGKPEPGASITILWERPSTVAEGSYQPYVESAEALVDPWGHQFILKIPGEKNIDFDIISYGADGQAGGTDENADIVKP